jgi:hypothetical protein
MEKWHWCYKDGNISWSLLSWLLLAIPAGMNNTGDSNDMHTSNLSHNHMKDNMIGMNQNADNILSSTKGDSTITTEKMSNMKGMRYR